MIHEVLKFTVIFQLLEHSLGTTMTTCNMAPSTGTYSYAIVSAAGFRLRHFQVGPEMSHFSEFLRTTNLQIGKETGNQTWLVGKPIKSTIK